MKRYAGKVGRDGLKPWSTALIAAIMCLSGAGVAAQTRVTVSEGCLNQRMRGVSLAGAEFNPTRVPAQHFRDYIYPSASQYPLFSDMGASVFRLPIAWERVQPTLFSDLDAAQVSLLRTAYDNARKSGDCLLIDLHNYGTHQGRSLGSSEVPQGALLDFWSRLAAVLPDDRHVALGLMNEPVRVSTAAWSRLAQEVVLGLRHAGARHYVMVAGGGWSGAHSWFKSDGSGVSSATAFANFQDPLDRSYFEVHQYADGNYSGTGNTCQSAEAIVPFLAAVGNWAESNGQKMFLGEFGVADNRACLATLQAMLEHVSNRPKAWAGWTYWAAGEWMTEYPLTAQPTATRVPGPLKTLQRYFTR